MPPIQRAFNYHNAPRLEKIINYQLSTINCNNTPQIEKIINYQLSNIN
jgi:hypothetical protein